MWLLNEIFKVIFLSSIVNLDCFWLSWLCDVSPNCGGAKWYCMLPGELGSIKRLYLNAILHTPISLSANCQYHYKLIIWPCVWREVALFQQPPLRPLLSAVAITCEYPTRQILGRGGGNNITITCEYPTRQILGKGENNTRDRRLRT